MRHFKILLILVLAFFALVAFAESPESFAKAKKIASQIFADHPLTLYCQCRYDEHHQVDLASCGMSLAEGISRAHRMEWEHMMPAEHMGRQLACWREPLCETHGKPYKGRRCCEKIDESFRHMEAELYNLWPAVGLVNQLRSNYSYWPLTRKEDTYGCAFAIDREHRWAEPPDTAKGIAARANLFMADHYGLKLSRAQRLLFEAWNRQFPADDWEKEWARRVAEKEGYRNPYIG